MEHEAVKPDQTRDEMRETMQRYELPLLQFATRIVGDADKAHDVVQETFLRLWQVGAHTIEGRLAEWLFTVCRNRAIDVRRRQRRLTPIDDRDEPATELDADPPWRRIQREQDMNVLCDLVAGLSDRQRRLIVMRFHHGWSYRQIAEATGLSATNVGYQIHMAIKTLRGRFARVAQTRGGNK